MKTQKLSFNAISGVMSRSEMKKIMAGSGTCAAQASASDGGMIGLDDSSRQAAINYATAHGTHWCCDSCSTASWYSGDI